MRAGGEFGFSKGAKSKPFQLLPGLLAGFTPNVANRLRGQFAAARLLDTRLQIVCQCTERFLFAHTIKGRGLEKKPSALRCKSHPKKAKRGPLGRPA